MPTSGQYDHKKKKLYQRCWVCGDSQHQDHAHLVIFLDSGFYQCYRCGTEGYLPLSQLWELTSNITIEPNLTTTSRLQTPEKLNLLHGPASDRWSSATKRSHLNTPEGKVDVFWSKDPQGEVVGYHLRSTWIKATRTVGVRALGYAEPALRRGEAYRLVEGPYDVLGARDICTFGFPNSSQLKALAFIPLILCPDGDLWLPTPDSRKKRVQYIEKFKRSSCQIIGVEILPDGLDPDECPPEKRELLTWIEFLRVWDGSSSPTRLKDRLEQRFSSVFSTPPPLDPLAQDSGWGPF